MKYSKQPNKILSYLTASCLVGLALISSAQAAPVSINISGIIQETSGIFTTYGLLNANYSGTFVIDNSATAASNIQTTPSSDPADPYTAAYEFPLSAGYGVHLEAPGIGSFTSTWGAAVRVYDNLFISTTRSGGRLAEGYYDMLEFSGGTTSGVCTLPSGCQSPMEQTPLSGEEQGLFLVMANTWLTGGALPSSLPAQSDIVMAFLNGSEYDASGNVIGTMFSNVNTNSLSVTAVPLPTSAWLLWSGLMGLMGMTRRRKAA